MDRRTDTPSYRDAKTHLKRPPPLIGTARFFQSQSRISAKTPILAAGGKEIFEKLQRYRVFLAMRRKLTKTFFFIYVWTGAYIANIWVSLEQENQALHCYHTSEPMFELFWTTFFLPMINCEQSLYSSIIGKRKLSSLFWAYQRIFVRIFDKKDTFFAMFQASEKKMDITIWFPTS